MSQYHILFILICIFLSLVESMPMPPIPYPFYVRVGASLTGSIEDLCGGVIVASNMVVTAASCLFTGEPFTGSLEFPQTRSGGHWATLDETFVYSGRSLVQKTTYSWVGKGWDSGQNYFTSHKVADYKVEDNDQGLMKDIALVILQDQFNFKSNTHVYLDFCGMKENGGYGPETGFILPRLEATEDVDEKRWIELSEINRRGDGKSPAGVLIVDDLRHVCFVKNNIAINYGDPLLYKSSSDEFQCLVGLKVGNLYVDDNPIFVRADWAFEWINQTINNKNQIKFVEVQ